MLNLDTLGLSAKVTDDGISAQDYQTILMRLTHFFHEIYGQDAYLTPDGKDGQMIAIYALALHDANNAIIATYNSFSQSTSTGVLHCLIMSPLMAFHATHRAILMSTWSRVSHQ